MNARFETIKAAAERAGKQFSPIYGKEADNIAVLKEMLLEIMAASTSLVHEAGGDNSYLEPWIDGIQNDIDLAFSSDFKGQTMFLPRRGLSLVVQL